MKIYIIDFHKFEISKNYNLIMFKHFNFIPNSIKRKKL